MDYNSIIAFDEPHPSGGNCRVTMTVKQAINWWRKCHPDKECSDPEALANMMAAHWAWVE